MTVTFSRRAFHCFARSIGLSNYTWNSQRSLFASYCY